MNDFQKLWGRIEDELGFNDHDMSRNRPYSGQPWTDTGHRGATEVKGVTFRDLRDCYIRAVGLASSHLNPAMYYEACKGENATLCENDIYALDWNQIDPMAVFQNFSCEVERLMDIFPNVPRLEYKAEHPEK